MNNPFKAGDKFIIAHGMLTGVYANSFRDCQECITYTVTAAGRAADSLAPSEEDILFTDDAGDAVLAKYELLTKV